MDDILGGIENMFSSIIKPILDIVNDIVNGVTNIMNMVKTIFDCIFAFFNFINEVCSYIGSFSIWLLKDFSPWIGQYFDCVLQKIINIPKCIFWYILDAFIFTVCIPFRFLIWILGIEKFLNNYLWDPMEELDSYIHDSDDDKLGTGFHIFHFPDSIQDKCYYCKINPIQHKMPPTCNLINAYNKFIYCRGGGPNNNVSKKKKCKLLGKVIEKGNGTSTVSKIDTKIEEPKIFKGDNVDQQQQQKPEIYFQNDNSFKQLDPNFQNNFIIGIKNISNNSIKTNNVYINNYTDLIKIKHSIIIDYIVNINTTYVNTYNYNNTVNEIYNLSNNNNKNTSNINSSVQKILDNFIILNKI
jgi:hypothetical protein